MFISLPSGPSRRVALVVGRSQLCCCRSSTARCCCCCCCRFCRCRSPTVRGGDADCFPSSVMTPIELVGTPVECTYISSHPRLCGHYHGQGDATTETETEKALPQLAWQTQPGMLRSSQCQRTEHCVTAVVQRAELFRVNKFYEFSAELFPRAAVDGRRGAARRTDECVYVFVCVVYYLELSKQDTNRFYEIIFKILRRRFCIDHRPSGTPRRGGGGGSGSGRR